MRLTRTFAEFLSVWDALQCEGESIVLRLDALTNEKIWTGHLLASDGIHLKNEHAINLVISSFIRNRAALTSFNLKALDLNLPAEVARFSGSFTEYAKSIPESAHPEFVVDSRFSDPDSDLAKRKLVPTGAERYTHNRQKKHKKH